MKNNIALSILALSIFGALTISTAELETAFDGNDTYGFPFTFLIIHGGKQFPALQISPEIFYLRLFLDFALAFLFAIIARTTYTKFRNYFQENKRNR